MGHPVGLFVLFTTEMWERFSFYSMRGFLVLYMTNVLAYNDKLANGIYGAYLGFVYATTFLGGILADRLLGQRLAIFIGGILMAVGQFTLMANALLMGAGQTDTVINSMFFIGLGFLSTGNGFFKPNISTIVGSLYQQGDTRRDGAFTIFYMGINIGAALAGLSGQAAEAWGWYWGFMLAGSGMVLSLIVLVFGKNKLQGKGLPPVAGAPWIKWLGLPKFFWVLIGALIVVPTISYFVAHPTWVQNISLYIAVPVLGYLLWEAFRGTREETGRMIVIIILCSFSMMFWAFFELAGSAINIFTDRYVNRDLDIWGWQWEAKASLITASLNAVFIVILGIPFARLWVWLNRRNLEPSSPLKFSLGLMQLALGFVMMYLGAVQAGDNGKCNIMYIVLGFLFHTTGELCLSPVGLSTITKLAPGRLVGMFMGVWFLASSLGNIFGGWVGGQSEEYGFATVFKGIAIAGGASGVLLLILTPVIKKLMYGVK